MTPQSIAYGVLTLIGFTTLYEIIYHLLLLKQLGGKGMVELIYEGVEDEI